MKRLDEEMHLNAFLFQDIERADSNNLSSEDKKSKEETAPRDSNEKKREYILRRAQIIVYQYGIKLGIYRRVMILACIFLAASLIGLAYYMIINGAVVNNRNYIYYLLYVCAICIVAMLVVICRYRIKKLYNIRQEIYSITVKFQTSVELYSSENRRLNLENFVVELEKYIEKERWKWRSNRAE